jgi:D-methionine transport system substrate-binding protein
VSSVSLWFIFNVFNVGRRNGIMFKNVKIVAGLVALTLVGSLFAGCGSKQQAATPAADLNKVYKVGVTAGPHAEIMEKVKAIAEKDGLKIQIVEFSDYVQPNLALAQGDIDINSFQHKPYLDTFAKDKNLELTSLSKTVIFPMGIYSKKIKSLDELKNGAIVAVPNDPTNGGRALLILQEAGLIKLKPGAGIKASPLDITENLKNIKIKELDAAQIPRSLDDVDAAAINTNYALPAGLIPTKDAIKLENPDSPYANLIVVRTKDKENPAYQKLVKAYQSPEVKQFILEHFKGSVVPAF